MDSPFLVLSAATISPVTMQLPDSDAKILLDITQIERFFKKTGNFSLGIIGLLSFLVARPAS
jgi:hypothetical protein